MPEDLTKIEEGIKKNKKKISQIKKGLEEFSADQLTTRGDFELPEPPEDRLPDLSRVSGRREYYKSLAGLAREEYETKLKEYEKKVAELEKEREPWWRSLLERKTLEERKKELWEELGVKPAEYFREREADIAELEGMQAEYDRKLAEKERALLGLEKEMAGRLTSVYQGQKALLQRQYNAELNAIAARIKAKAAAMEAKQGNFNEARNFVREAISDYTWDLKMDYQLISEFEERNKDLLDELKGEYKTALAEYKESIRREIETTEEEKEKVMELMLKYPTSAITIDDSLEEAVKKAKKAESVVTTTTLKPPTTRTIEGKLYQWNPEIQAWEPAPVIEEEEEIPAPPDYVNTFQQYKQAGWDRESVENAWISQYNEGKPSALQLKDKKEMYKRFPEIKSALDQVFGEPPGALNKLKQWWSGIWGK